MSSLTVFNYNDNQVRTVLIDNEVWFVAKDILKAMNSTTKVTELKTMINDGLGEEFWKTEPLETSGGLQKLMIVSKPALTLVLGRSRTELGKAMNRWLHAEVIPSIEKTGSYSIENLSPARQIIKMGESMLALEEEQARQAKELEETKVIANEAKEGLAQVRNELSSLKEFAVAQPQGLSQDQADLINQAFQNLGAVLAESGVPKPKCYQDPWKQLGVTMRNSSINYDLNARISNAKKKYQQNLEVWESNGKPRGKKPTKPTRISVLMRDNKLTDAFKAAQQVVSSHLSNLTK